MQARSLVVKDIRWRLVPVVHGFVSASTLVSIRTPAPSRVCQVAPRQYPAYAALSTAMCDSKSLELKISKAGSSASSQDVIRSDTLLTKQTWN